MRKFAISDIHGCTRSFKALLQKLDFSILDELYLLGDFVDRGPDSKGIFDHIFQLQASGHKVFCLKGNHEAMMLNSKQSPEKYLHWLRNGGRETLNSFGTTSLFGIAGKYRKFIDAMPYYFEVDNYLLVHAGFNFNVPTEDILEETTSMLWIRNWYKDIKHDWLDGRIIVHGHTPVSEAEIRVHFQHLNKLPVIDIDAGCVYATRKRNLGKLCAFELGSRSLTFQEMLD